ncbi:MAG: helix-turn-helix domain-containing protein [Methanobrevibacter sp.]|jgi:transposase-like protein|nr:helix-turn-helix domain-containing protein [Candidatus Methanovirga australis]
MGKRGPKPSFVNVPCPNKGGDDYGKIGNENVVGNGTYKTKNGTVHKYICRTCSKNFTSRANTILHDLRTDEKTVFLALKMILKGMSLRSTAEILNVKLDTVRRWLQISSKHCEEVNQVLMKDIDVDKVELDELWTFVKKNISEHGLPIRK